MAASRSTRTRKPAPPAAERSPAAGVIDELSAARSSQQSEVAARASAQLELEYLALRNPLTGLLNRRGSFGSLEQMSVESRLILVLATVDIDRFKHVNDTRGHAAGDVVLQAVGERLGDAAGESAIVTRLGGDEFVAAMIGGAGGDRIRRELAALDVVGLGSGTLRVFCSVGVAVHSAQASIDATLACADAAPHRHKARSGDKPLALSDATGD